MSIRSFIARIAGSVPAGVVTSVTWSSRGFGSGWRVQGSRRGLADLHPDALGLGVVVERGRAEHPAVAGLLDSAIGHGRVHHLVGVDPDGADPQRTAGPVRAGQVAGPHPGSQPVL